MECSICGKEGKEEYRFKVDYPMNSTLEIFFNVGTSYGPGLCRDCMKHYLNSACAQMEDDDV